MANRNKNLGKACEREICAILTEGTGKNWMRVPNSGSFIGQKNSTRMKDMSNNQILLARGDVIPPDEYKHIIIEVKHRKNFSFNKLYDGGTDLDKWIAQASVDHSLSDSKIMLVVFKIPLRGCYVAVEESEIENFKLKLEAVKMNYMRYHYAKTDKYFVICNFNADWVKQFIALPNGPEQAK